MPGQWVSHALLGASCLLLVSAGGCASTRSADAGDGPASAVRTFSVAATAGDWSAAADVADYETAAQIVQLARLVDAARGLPDETWTVQTVGPIPTQSTVGAIRARLGAFALGPVEVRDTQTIAADSAEVEVWFTRDAATGVIPVIRLAGQWRVDLARSSRPYTPCSPEACPDDYVWPDGRDAPEVEADPSGKAPPKPADG